MCKKLRLSCTLLNETNVNVSRNKHTDKSLLAVDRVTRENIIICFHIIMQLDKTTTGHAQPSNSISTQVPLYLRQEGHHGQKC